MIYLVRKVVLLLTGFACFSLLSAFPSTFTPIRDLIDPPQKIAKAQETPHDIYLPMVQGLDALDTFELQLDATEDESMTRTLATRPHIIYTESLRNGWTHDPNWARIDLGDRFARYGRKSISASANRWDALALRRSPLSTSGYESIGFWLYCNENHAELRFEIKGKPQKRIFCSANHGWKRYIFTLSDLGNPSSITEIYWKAATDISKFHVDHIYLKPKTSPPPSATQFYVSKRNDGRSGNNGLSWNTAWGELDQINWSKIHPGATIWIDGGASSLTYNTTLTIGKSGASGNPITIAKSTQSGRNGQVILDGDNQPNIQNDLPECSIDEPGHSNYSSRKYSGINTNTHDWIVINGQEWGGILVRDFQLGIDIARNEVQGRAHNSSDNVKVRYVEVVNIGKTLFETGDSTYPDWRGWTSDGFGVKVAGKNNVLEYMLIHDNAQDAIQSHSERWNSRYHETYLENLTVRNSWLYNSRRHSGSGTITQKNGHVRSLSDLPFNFCRHSDGIQIFDGGIVDGLTVEDSVLGPGFTHNLILGEHGDKAKAVVRNVKLKNVLLTKATDNNVYTKWKAGMTRPTGWHFDRVTIHCPMQKKWGKCVEVYDGTRVTNSVIAGSSAWQAHAEVRVFNSNYKSGGTINASSNCQWQTTGVRLPGAKSTNPTFRNVTDTDPFSFQTVGDHELPMDDYTMQSRSCTSYGSGIKSVRQLLGVQ